MMQECEARCVEKPWGYEIWWAQTERHAGKILSIKAGHRLSLQEHREKDESSYLFSGRLRLSRGATEDDLEDEEIEPGYCWRVEPGTVHSIETLEDSLV
jgi:mannose-6-phosphate isomerase